MRRWTANTDPAISTRANRQYNQKDAVTEEMLTKAKKILGVESAGIPSYPNIRNRCLALGDKWAFSYDHKYRGLSAWQHGDMTRIIATPSLRQMDSSQLERPVFEGLAQLSWAWDLTYDFTKELMKIVRNSEDLDKLNLINRASLSVVLSNLREALDKFQGIGKQAG